MPDGTRHIDAMQRFTPGPDTQRAFRDALGQFSTGVTVVTAQTVQGPLGMTANSFASISMDPALVMWSPAKSSSRHAHFIQARHFAVHVLSGAQEEIALGFARSGDAFDGLDVEFNTQGVPLLRACLARFECSRYQIHDAGDHSIILGLVTSAASRPGAPLVFCQGRFGRLDVSN